MIINQINSVNKFFMHWEISLGFPLPASDGTDFAGMPETASPCDSPVFTGAGIQEIFGDLNFLHADKKRRPGCCHESICVYVILYALGCEM